MLIRREKARLLGKELPDLHIAQEDQLIVLDEVADELLAKARKDGAQ